VPLRGGEALASFLLPPGQDNVRWTPDGKALTFIDRQKDWNLFRKPLPDGKIEQLTHFREGQIVDYAWHPDGSRIVLHRRLNRQESLWTLKPGESEPTLVTEFKTGRIAQHHWAPDSDLLYFTYGDSTQDVVMITNFR
jgi:Tol biopolymer transport system component